MFWIMNQQQIMNFFFQTKMYTEEYWKTIKNADKKDILSDLEFLQNCLLDPYFQQNEDVIYLLEEACEKAYYVLVTCEEDEQILGRIMEIALEIIKRSKGQRVRFARDVYLNVYLKGNQYQNKVIQTFLEIEDLGLDIVDSTIFELYDGRITEINVENIAKVLYDFRNCQGFVERNAPELLEVFDLMGQKWFENEQIRELFHMFTNRYPLIVGKL